MSVAPAGTKPDRLLQTAWMQVALKNDFVHMLTPKDMMIMACTNSTVQEIFVLTMTERIAWSNNELDKQQNSMFTEVEMSNIKVKRVCS